MLFISPRKGRGAGAGSQGGGIKTTSQSQWQSKQVFLVVTEVRGRTGRSKEINGRRKNKKVEKRKNMDI